MDFFRLDFSSFFSQVVQSSVFNSEIWCSNAIGGHESKKKVLEKQNRTEKVLTRLFWRLLQKLFRRRFY